MSKARKINFEQVVYDAFGQVKDFTLAMRIARYFYEKAEKELDFGEDGFVRFTESVKALVDAVEGYIAPTKGDKYVFRNEVLAKCNNVKKLLGK